MAELSGGVVEVENETGDPLLVSDVRLPAALDNDGGLKVHVQNPSAGGGVAASVTVDASALPAGASTEATLALAKTALDLLHTDLAAAKTDLDALVASTGAIGDAASASTVIGRLKAVVNALGGTLAVSAAALPLPAGAATEAGLTGLGTALTALNAKDFATHAEQVAIEALLTAIRDNTANIKLDADHLSIEADAINLNTDGVEGKLDTLNAKDFATQATLVAAKAVLDALNAKDYATQATLAAAKVDLDAIAAATGTTGDSAALNTLVGRLKTIASALGGTLAISAAALPLPAGAATEATLATIAGKDFATAAGQTTQATKLDTLHADLVTVQGYVDGIEGALTTLNAKDFATQTTLALVLAALPAALSAGRFKEETLFADLIATGNITAVAQTVQLACAGCDSWGLFMLGTFASANLTFEASPDGGTTWLPSVVIGTSSGASVGTTTTAAISTNGGYEGNVPPWATHVRVRCTAITSGTVNVTLAASARPAQPQVAIAAQNGPIGKVNNYNGWLLETSSTLTSGSTFTGASADLLGNASAATGNLTTTVGVAGTEVRYASAADVAGTLYLEISDDGTTWQRVKGVAATQFDGTCKFAAEIEHKVKARFARCVYVNGGTNQASFRIFRTSVVS